MKPGEALAMFVDELGATMSVMVNRSTSYTDTRRYIAQSTANDIGPDMAHKGVHLPLVHYDFPTYAHRPTVARLAILWDRPTPQAASHRAFLRRSLAGLGLDASQVANIWAYPFALPSPPLENQVLQYLPATLEALHASGAHYVMLLGSTCMKLWRRELLLSQVSGKIAVMRNTWFVYPAPNPIVAVMDGSLMFNYREHIRTIVDIVQSDTGLDELGLQCVEKDCLSDGAIDSRVFVYDPDGVPWCKTHWRKGFKRRIDHQHKMTQHTNAVYQDGML